MNENMRNLRLLPLHRQVRNHHRRWCPKCRCVWSPRVRITGRDHWPNEPVTRTAKLLVTAMYHSMTWFHVGVGCYLALGSILIGKVSAVVDRVAQEFDGDASAARFTSPLVLLACCPRHHTAHSGSLHWSINKFVSPQNSILIIVNRMLLLRGCSCEFPNRWTN